MFVKFKFISVIMYWELGNKVEMEVQAWLGTISLYIRPHSKMPQEGYLSNFHV